MVQLFNTLTSRQPSKVITLRDFSILTSESESDPDISALSSLAKYFRFDFFVGDVPSRSNTDPFDVVFWSISIPEHFRFEFRFSYKRTFQNKVTVA